MYDAAVSLDILPTGKIRFNEIREKELSIRHDFCVEFNKTQMRVNKMSFTNLRAQSIVEKAPLHDCGGKFFVHKFLPCDVRMVSTSVLSRAGVSLYLCDNGLQVHYSLACDGHDDCFDNSDEYLCLLNNHVMELTKVSGVRFKSTSSDETHYIHDGLADRVFICRSKTQVRKYCRVLYSMNYFSILNVKTCDPNVNPTSHHIPWCLPAKTMKD